MISFTINGFRHRLACLLLVAGGVWTVADAAGTITPEALQAEIGSEEAPRIIDIRRGQDYQKGHIPGAINIPLRLLAVRSLPPFEAVVVYGDGFGLDTGAEAAAIIEEKSDWDVRILSGGYAGWKTAGGLTTEPTGLRKEALNQITYQQLMAADRSNYVMVDLRKSEDNDGGAGPAGLRADAVADFARELGMPRTRNDPTQLVGGSSGGAGPASSRSSGMTLLLVADDEEIAQNALRSLRGQGFHQVTILVGGEEIIKHKGKSGLGRKAITFTVEEPEN